MVSDSRYRCWPRIHGSAVRTKPRSWNPLEGSCASFPMPDACLVVRCLDPLSAPRAAAVLTGSCCAWRFASSAASRAASAASSPSRLASAVLRGVLDELFGSLWASWHQAERLYLFVNFRLTSCSCLGIPLPAWRSRFTHRRGFWASRSAVHCRRSPADLCPRERDHARLLVSVLERSLDSRAASTAHPRPPSTLPRCCARSTGRRLKPRRRERVYHGCLYLATRSRTPAVSYSAALPDRLCRLAVANSSKRRWTASLSDPSAFAATTTW